MPWYSIVFLVVVNNYLWWAIFSGYRKGVKIALHQSGKERYNDIREAQQMAFNTVAKVELQARANALYEAADLLKGTPEAVVSRTELLERRNKVLEQMNGVYNDNTPEDLTTEEIEDMRKGLNVKR